MSLDMKKTIGDPEVAQEGDIGDISDSAEVAGVDPAVEKSIVGSSITSFFPY